MTLAQGATAAIAGFATLGVITRPWKLPEAVWALLGAAVLILAGLLPPADALVGIGKGTDVYLFLAGMMLLAEVAREEGLFDWLAALAVRLARGSPDRLFALVYAVGTVVTVFLSNDATAVVLTPAVYAAAKAAGAEPLPYLFICAFIANAASFVLPISNPANLVVFADHMPALGDWLSRFALPSLLAIASTYVVLRATQRTALRGEIVRDMALPALGLGGRLAALGIAATAVALTVVSTYQARLGVATAACGLVTVAVVTLAGRQSPWRYARDISWSVLPLVAGLFMLVEALDRAGLLRALSRSLDALALASATGAAWIGGLSVALVSNLVNNLPTGLLADAAVQASHPPPQVASAILIGVDLGPNLSVTGSLATILWLAVLRREKEEVGALQFLKIGCLVMPISLALALAGLILTG